MIGKIRGVVDIIGEEFAIIDVRGLGYRVFCSAKTLGFLEGKKGAGEISLFIETSVKEDHIHLYGFVTEQEKYWFLELCKVSGVGNKVAIKILGTLDIDEMHFAINSGDYKSFTRAPGVGKKVAERIVTELKGRAAKLGGSVDGFVSGQNLNETVVVQDLNFKNSKINIISDAVAALESLGYDRSRAYKICVEKYGKDCNITLESMITEALRDLSSFNK